MNRVLITILLGSSFAALPLAAAAGNEGAAAGTPAGIKRDVGWTVLPLPPVPQLDTIQWLYAVGDPLRQPKILGPQVDYLSPSLIDPTASPTQFSQAKERANLNWRGCRGRRGSARRGR